MSDSKSNPPRRAIWFLQYVCPGDNEALTGDLIEKFREGQTPAWFWKQVLVAFAFAVLRKMRPAWPCFCYALAGTAIPFFLWKTVEGLPGAVHWWALPWPWSQVILELSRTALLALAALPVLAVGLTANRSFRWFSLFRTGTINLALIVLGKYLLDLMLAVFPWLLRPVPGNPYLKTILFLPPPTVELLSFFSFFVSAWLGCRDARDHRITEPRASASGRV